MMRGFVRTRTCLRGLLGDSVQLGGEILVLLQQK